MSFQISIQPNRQVAARFVDSVRRTLVKALMDSKISQSDIARKLGVHRSVIHRELKGYQDITLGRAAELAWALGKKANFSLEGQFNEGANHKASHAASAQVAPIVALPVPIGSEVSTALSPNQFYRVTSQ